jgi:hypothetical protein
MTKRFGIVIMIVGLSAIAGCAQNEGDTTKPPAQGSTLQFARAAVEVGEISLGEMEAYQANVIGMNTSERSKLWQRLEQLHGGVHAAASGSPPAGVDEGDDAICSSVACSHSGKSKTKLWCCAFNENATFYNLGCASRVDGCGGEEEGGGDQSN